MFEPPKKDVPTVGDGYAHVFFELGDHLGSTSVVLDKATSELVERATFEGYGARESDYRPERWEAFREDYGFTGKEEDVEVGLQYFGKRYYAPALNRWVSADPLAVHSPGEADLNVYAYVSGHALKATDPLGLAEDYEKNVSFEPTAMSSSGAGMDQGAATGGAVETPGPYAQPTATAPQAKTPARANPKVAAEGAGGSSGLGGSKGAGGGGPGPAPQKSPSELLRQSENESVIRAIEDSTAKGCEACSEWAARFWHAPPVQPEVGEYIGPEGGKLMLSLAAFGRGTPSMEPPTLEIDASRMPAIARNITSAQKAGQPVMLNREERPALIAANRKAACAGFCGPGSPDEYPFASTMQGGAGAQVTGVPLKEQRIQGGVMSQFYKKEGIKQGDPFRVVVKKPKTE